MYISTEDYKFLLDCILAGMGLYSVGFILYILFPDTFEIVLQKVLPDYEDY